MDRNSEAWAPAPHRGPSFEKFAERLHEFGCDQKAQKSLQKGRFGFER